MGGLNEKEHHDFLMFRNQFKNVIFGFFGVEKLIKIFISSSRIIQNFEKIDLQNWNLRPMRRAHVTIFGRFFCTNRLIRHVRIAHRDFWRSNVKRGHLRSNLRFWLKNSFAMTRDSHVRKNFLPRPSNDLKFSDLVEKITEIISILVSKFYDNHKRR